MNERNPALAAAGSRSPALAAAVALAALIAAVAGLAGGVEPFATAFYTFAWFPTLLLADAVVARREGTWFLLGRPAFTATLFAWSAVFWLLFEVVNLRLANWFYVFVPDARAVRWTGTVVAFATVLPAILMSERLLDSFGVARATRSKPFVVTERFRAVLQGAGILSFALVLLWPRLFFPLAWGGVWLLADPFVHRRDPARSLLGDLERGRPGRTLRLLLGGLAIGLVWEVFNARARGKWIYTVPGFEEGKLFEMPVLGFLGFPFLALEGFAAWQALVVTGLAIPREGEVRPAPRLARAAAGVLAAVFSALAILAMERGTVASTTPRLADLPGAPAVAAHADWDVFSLARARPADVARVSGVSQADAVRWVDSARLASLRGLGTANAARLRGVGIASVADLEAADPAILARRLSQAGTPIRAARLRVWVRAAREEGS